MVTCQSITDGALPLCELFQAREESLYSVCSGTAQTWWPEAVKPYWYIILILFLRLSGTVTWFKWPCLQVNIIMPLSLQILQFSGKCSFPRQTQHLSFIIKLKDWYYLWLHYFKRKIKFEMRINHDFLKFSVIRNQLETIFTVVQFK